MKTINVTTFKTNCLQLIDEANRTGESIEVTKRGKSVGTFNPSEAKEVSFGKFRHMGKVVGDIISPIDVEWEAMS